MKTTNELKAMDFKELEREMDNAMKNHDGDYQTLVEDILVARDNQEEKKLKTFIASVTIDGKLATITRERETKKEFKEELRSNGFKVRVVSTPENFDRDIEKRGERLENQKRLRHFIKESRKQHGL